MTNYRDHAPQILCDFLSYHENIKAHSQKTVDEYFLDLRNFFRYMKQSRDQSLRDTPWDEISIMDVDAAFIRTITLTDIYGYLTFLSRDRAQQPNSRRTEYGLSATTRARKIATLRSFFNYLTKKVHILDDNPIKDMDSPKLKKTLPKYLTLDESLELLNSVDGANSERDYCILTLFLNCGLRISELIGLNLNDIQDDALRVLGKGNKVRIVYLNDACKDALEQYLAVQAEMNRRTVEYSRNNGKKQIYPFTGKLICDCCRKHYQRKKTAVGYVWICSTFNREGKSACPSRQIPEITLEKLSAEVLGLPEFNAEIFGEQIEKIDICNNCVVKFHFADGHEETKHWQVRSRSESWTAEMREKARKKSCRE